MKIIMFKSPTCAPCKMMAPYIERAARTYPDVQFEICDVSTDTKGTATKNGVRAFPTIMAFDENEVKLDVVRTPMTESQLNSWIEGLV